LELVNCYFAQISGFLIFHFWSNCPLTKLPVVCYNRISRRLDGGRRAKKQKAEGLTLDPFPLGAPEVVVNQIFNRVADYFPQSVNHFTSITIHPDHFFISFSFFVSLL
jgi:hypothetical protein